MNILVINGHPDKKSFSTAIFNKVIDNLDNKKHEIETLNLADMKFDPVLRFGYRERMEEDAEITRSQELIQWADHLIFIYPIWWSSMPSLMKGWIDRVFTPGVAYSSNHKGIFILNFITGQQFKKLLKGKTADIITTSQGPSWWYKIFSGIISVPDSYGVAVLKNAVLNHCGIKTRKVMNLGDMNREPNTLEVREIFLEKVAKHASKIYEESMKDNNLNTNQEVSKDEKKGGFFKKDSKAEKLHAENLELKNDLQRTRADFENYRKNVESRVSNAQNLGEKKAILALIPMVDDIERAISHLPEELAQNAWAQNVVKMSKNLDKSLSKIGVEKINSAEGTVFNPELHEAIQFDEDSEGEEEIILAELRAGYTLKGEVLRAAMVKVGRQ